MKDKISMVKMITNVMIIRNDFDVDDQLVIEFYYNQYRRQWVEKTGSFRISINVIKSKTHKK